MADRTHWTKTWTMSAPEYTHIDHASIIQVMLLPANNNPMKGLGSDGNSMDLSDMGMRLPMLVYVSCEKCSGYDHNKRQGNERSGLSLHDNVFAPSSSTSIATTTFTIPKQSVKECAS
ncbi:unnamed protein product [Linum trigynum]|uniref:Uncharacterized protein n=1 Tax=Linum trigynum TaxID=586398 RepID=A0AAV2FF32_9ROSI